MDEKQFNEVVIRLDKILRLLALSTFQGTTMTDKILALHRTGFRPMEIANILGTSKHVVNVRLSEMRKKTRDKYGKETV